MLQRINGFKKDAISWEVKNLGLPTYRRSRGDMTAFIFHIDCVVCQPLIKLLLIYLLTYWNIKCCLENMIARLHLNYHRLSNVVDVTDAAEWMSSRIRWHAAAIVDRRERERERERGEGQRRGERRWGRRACGRVFALSAEAASDFRQMKLRQTAHKGHDIDWRFLPLPKSPDCINLHVQTPVCLHVHLTMGRVLFSFIPSLIRPQCSCLTRPMAQYLL